jgi:hypothetical protein
MFIHAKAGSLFPVLASIVHAACRSVLGWHSKLGRHNVQAFVVCMATAKLVILFMQYEGSEKCCAVVAPKFLAFQCVLVCVCVGSSLTPTYVAGSEDINRYQSLSVVGARPGDRVDPHGASTISLTPAADLGVRSGGGATGAAATTMGEASSDDCRTVEHRIVIHQVTKEISGGCGFPTFSKTNYSDWAALMRAMLQARDPN